MIGNNLSYSAESKLIKNQKIKFIILDISDLLDRAPENQGFIWQLSSQPLFSQNLDY